MCSGLHRTHFNNIHTRRIQFKEVLFELDHLITTGITYAFNSTRTETIKDLIDDRNEGAGITLCIVVLLGRLKLLLLVADVIRQQLATTTRANSKSKESYTLTTAAWHIKLCRCSYHRWRGRTECKYKQTSRCHVDEQVKEDWETPSCSLRKWQKRKERYQGYEEEF